jgi:hypothetical protein
VSEPVLDLAEADSVTGTHFDVAHDTPAIEERAVHRTEITEPPLPFLVAQNRVLTRDGGVHDDAIAFAGASERHAISEGKGKSRSPCLVPGELQACRPQRKTRDRNQKQTIKRTSPREVDQKIRQLSVALRRQS